MGKKTTVRDVAREAGVSVATVSYIMNGRTDQKISPETKKKVLQIANLLNYQPSHAAKSLVTGRNNIVGIAYQIDNLAPSHNTSLATLIELLIERLNRMHYDVLMLPSTTESIDSVKQNVDAVIAIDLEDSTFRQLADHLLVPIIGVDMIINDNLFYQIYDAYDLLMLKACKHNPTEFTLILDRFSNTNFYEFVTQTLPFAQILDYSELTIPMMKELKTKNVLIIGNYLATMLYPFLTTYHIGVITSQKESLFSLPDVSYFYLDFEKKANLTMNILLNALDHNFELDHDVKILY